MGWNGASHCEFDGKSMETETTTWSEFPIGGEAIVEQILESEERNKSKRAGLWESQSGIQIGKLTIWVRPFETKNLWQSSSGRSVPPESVSQSLWWTLKSPKTKILADGLIERTSFMLDKIESKTVQMKKAIDTGKRSKTMSEVKPVENVSKNLESFLDISPVQKKVFL